MAASGLQIFMAFSSFGPRGARYGWVPAHGIHVPAWLQMGGWLEGARGLHFAFGWLLVASGLQRLGYTTALLLGILEMGSGLDLWKLAQLHTLGVPLFS